MAPPTQLKQYLSIFNQFMSHHRGRRYAKYHEHATDDLLDIEPIHIAKWMKKKAYGTETPVLTGEHRDHPIHARSNSLEYYKKAISYFMPNNHFPWNVITKQGNPTQAREVNEVINDVKFEEVRKKGSRSQARRRIEKSEFEQTLVLLKSSDSYEQQYMATAAAVFMYNMIARIDDTAEFEKEDMTKHEQFPFALKVKMCWSKNIREERESPVQILLGSDDPFYCALVNLAIFLEVWLEAGHGHHPYLFGKGVHANTNKANLARIFSNIWNRNDFVKRKTGPLGTHSLRKFPTTLARNAGCSKDEVDHRARWRKKRVSDRYTDINLPHVDAKVAATLCMGGPVMYTSREGCEVTTEWLRTHVVPSIVACSAIPDGVADVLALPLLWAAFEDTVVMPSDLRSRITQGYASVHAATTGNPVVKIHLVIMGHDDVLDIQPIVPFHGDDSGANENIVAEARNTQFDVLRALYSQSIGHSRSFAEMKTLLDNLKMQVSNDFCKVRRTMERNSPSMHFRSRVREQREEPSVVETVISPMIAALESNPKSLNVLWQEYTIGIGGRKAAKDFTAEERGRMKTLYSKRKIVWDKISLLIRAGHSADVAIDRIYATYGQSTPITKIIEKMRVDNATGGHPNLRI